METLCTEIGLTHRVTFTGLLDDSEKLSALRDADAFVLPSRFEGLSIALLEALLVGVPCLVTDRVGGAELVKRTGAGIVVSPNVESIRLGLERLANDNVLAQMRGKARDVIQREYTWDGAASRLLAELAL